MTPAPNRGWAAAKRGLSWVVGIGAALVVIALGEASPALQALERAMAEHRGRWLAATLGPAILGWVLLMTGAISMAIGGPTRGQASFAEVKAAWRARAWCGSTRWRQMFLMGLGALLMLVGGFGAVVVAGTPGIKLLFGGALIYALVRTVVAFHRA